MVVRIVDFVLVPITKRMYFSAKQKSLEMGELNNSIMKGKRNIIGFLGEELIIRYFSKAKAQNTYDYDIILGNLLADIKSKQTSVEPRLNFDVSVPAFNTRQKTDAYIFCRIFKKDWRYPQGWIIGWMFKNDFYKKARFYKKGDYDKSNNFTFNADSYNLSINQLNQTNSLIYYI